MGEVNSQFIDRVAKAYVHDTTNKPILFRSTTVDEVPEQIPVVLFDVNGMNIYGYNIYNPNGVDVFVRIYDKATTPTVGTDTITETIQVPAGGSVVLKGTDVLFTITTKGWVAATTGYLDNNTTAPGLDLICEITYK
jgi:hypothetical protein